MARLVAVLDANVPYPARLRDRFLRLAIARMFGIGGAAAAYLHGGAAPSSKNLSGRPLMTPSSRLPHACSTRAARREHGMDQIDSTSTQYMVVINEEEQYSIWRLRRPVPAGWSQVGVTGELESCLDYIESVWTDMRPKSLRLQMDTVK